MRFHAARLTRTHDMWQTVIAEARACNTHSTLPDGQGVVIRNMEITTLVLADCRNLIRQGIRFLLESQPALSVVGEVSESSQLIDVIDRLRPDVLLMDPAFPSSKSTDLVQQLKQKFPRVRLIVLTLQNSEIAVRQALRSGADGYVLKDDDFTVLLQAIQDVVGGRRYLSPSLHERALRAFADPEGLHTLRPRRELTKRETEIMKLAVNGLTSTAIAARLSISPRTAETHRGNLMRKLGVHSQAELVRYAINSGMLEDDVS